MKIYNNYKFSSILGISHFLTDGIAAYVLTFISINIININNFYIDTSIGIKVFEYFIIYNFLAFFGQVFVGYFIDKIKDNKKFFKISKIIIIFSFAFYILGTILLTISYLLAVISIGIGSCLFHLGSGNITLLSEKNKATNLGIFASGGVIGLSFGGFIALFMPWIIILINILLLGITHIIYKNKTYLIEKDNIKKTYNLHKKLKKYLHIFIGFLLIILIIRSTIWTQFQIEFIIDKITIFYLALVAFFGKIIGGILEDNKNFKDKYFIFIGLLSLFSIFIYSFYYKNIILLLIGIFLIQIFVSPITIIIYKILPHHKSKIIGFTFGMSLILGFLLLKSI